MGRRGFKFCILCHPDGNGVEGENKAVGKYYLPRRSGQAFSGWIPVCEFCIAGVKNAGFEVTYFNNLLEQTANMKSCNCQFEKKNLVTPDDGDIRDIWKCKYCGKEIRSLGNPGKREEFRERKYFKFKSEFVRNDER